ncbi:MAG: gamma-glutamylcyclotransferase family protein, partial [Bryobacteraceae bacterium]
LRDVAMEAIRDIDSRVPAELLRGAGSKLAVYGSLAPGKANHDRLGGMLGAWRSATVRGHLRNSGWGAAVGFPGLVWDPEGPEVDVAIFESPGLPDRWADLDQFEGPDYRRILVTISSGDEVTVCSLYALSQDG